MVLHTSVTAAAPIDSLLASTAPKSKVSPTSLPDVDVSIKGAVQFLLLGLTHSKGRAIAEVIPGWSTGLCSASSSLQRKER